jgi:hypothetical protein
MLMEFAGNSQPDSLDAMKDRQAGMQSKERGDTYKPWCEGPPRGEDYERGQLKSVE